ncbi:nucleotide exchange factor GrpE [Dethiosulfovibrio salsuginis]|uniref:Protein GrpE n=1 Tax=Dethiosulfovibrio salsuginis TaxID=561720 RepID=A0A1X7J207_9BACT|nr:nucleotide exchange factor GrpE [Dethiosulfovibrio salsuginis]SMG21709.1 molecular chaperone GrpE/heat-inducible transcriptional repressor [Dethiosulfovibrio salsuginis]
MEDVKGLPEEELLEEDLNDGSPVKDEIAGYLERIEALENERETFREVAGRAQAELVNYRARMDREMKKVRELAGEKSVLEMIPVLDNLDRALNIGDGADLSTVVEGIKMVRRQFMGSLEALGVKVIPAAGEPFSPEYHEAVGVVEVEDPSEDGLVIDEFQRGYTLSDRVIRPSKVRVGSYSEKE